MTPAIVIGIEIKEAFYSYRSLQRPMYMPVPVETHFHIYAHIVKKL